MSARFRVQVNILESGERLPILIEASTAIPVPLPNRWVLWNRRQRVSYNTIQRELRTLAHVIEWAEEQSIDLKARFKSGNGLSDRETESLNAYLRRDFTHGQAVSLLYVDPLTHATRLDTVKAYVTWLMETAMRRMDVRDSRFDRVREKRDLTVKQLDALKARGRVRGRMGLSTTLRNRLLDVIRPDSPENPFQPSTRRRNYVMILLYLLFGFRRAELLVLTLRDVDLSGLSPVIRLRRVRDRLLDKRKEEPRVKTRGRDVPLTPAFAREVQQYIDTERRRGVGAKKTPFLFLAFDTGQPLTLRAVNHMFERIVAVHPEFNGVLTTHVLRHTFNDAFSDIAKRTGLTPQQEKQIRNYVCGWGTQSDQGNDYNLRHIRDESNRLLAAMQSQLFSVLDDVPM